MTTQTRNEAAERLTRHVFEPGPDPMLCRHCGQPQFSSTRGPDFYHKRAANTTQSKAYEQGFADGRRATVERIRERLEALGWVFDAETDYGSAADVSAILDEEATR